MLAYAVEFRIARRSGITLLELMLALALTVLLLVAIAMAVNLHLSMLDARRTNVEEAQLARALFDRISSDLRSSVAYNEVDFDEAARLASGGSLSELGDGLLEGSDAEEGDNPGSKGDDVGEDVLPEEEETEAAQRDIANSLTPATIPGIYGNQYQLQCDISRLPRIEEFEPPDFTDSAKLHDLPSDLKTVAYYLLPDTGEDARRTGGATDNVEINGPAQSTGAWGRGLARRALDRSTTQWAVENGDTSRLDQSGQLLADEVVALEFRYFDGQTWQLEWDSQQQGGLPVAIEVLLAIESAQRRRQGESQVRPANLLDETAQADGLLVFRQIIRIPAARPIDEAAPVDMDGEQTPSPSPSPSGSGPG